MSPETEPQPEPQPAPQQAQAPQLPAHFADSAGQAWAGRSFDNNTHASDDGSAPAALIEALRRFQTGEAGEDAVVDAFRDARLLIPLIAHLGEEGVGAHGHTIDKTQELSIVTVAGPDGRNVLPVFSSVQALTVWNREARPVPADGVRVALAAASEGTELVVLDPTSPTEFVVRRPALWAIAQSQPWSPSHASDAVLAALEASIASEMAVTGVEIAPGDPHARMAGPELIVRLRLLAGLNRAELDVILARLAARWAADDTIALRVDSLKVELGQ